MSDIYDSTWHPEDDLPAWVFDYKECDTCEGVIDEGRDYSEYGITVCACVECKVCDEPPVLDDECLIFNIPISFRPNPSFVCICICYDCSMIIENALEGDFLERGN